MDNDLPGLIGEPPLELRGGDAGLLMSLLRVDDDLFVNAYNQSNLDGRLFGGQVLGQSLAAAMATVEGRDVHSMHGYFLRPGSFAQRVSFTVQRVRDGRRFATRRVTATQAGKPIFEMNCSFFEQQKGYEHQAEMPDVPAPETLLNLAQLAEANLAARAPQLAVLAGLYPIDARPIDPGMLLHSTTAPHQQCWIRLASSVETSDPRVHQQLIAYLSDHWLISAALARHRVAIPHYGLEVASIDHAIWFHRPARADEWLLYVADSPSALNGVNLSRGMIFRRDGALAASTAQEALQRHLD